LREEVGSLFAIRVRGEALHSTYFQHLRVARAPHPNPLPARAGRGRKRAFHAAAIMHNRKIIPLSDLNASNKLPSMLQ